MLFTVHRKAFFQGRFSTLASPRWRPVSRFDERLDVTVDAGPDESIGLRCGDTGGKEGCTPSVRIPYKKNL